MFVLNAITKPKKAHKVKKLTKKVNKTLPSRKSTPTVPKIASKPIPIAAPTKTISKPPVVKQPPAAPAKPIAPPQSNMANRINNYLAGSPMAGMGQVFYNAAVANGIDPCLSPAIAKKESSLGRRIPGGFNAFGMTAGTVPGHGRIGRWQTFSSWQDAIESNISFIHKHWGAVNSPYQMNGYCSPNQPWMGDVQSIMNGI